MAAPGVAPQRLSAHAGPACQARRLVPSIAEHSGRERERRCGLHQRPWSKTFTQSNSDNCDRATGRERRSWSHGCDNEFGKVGSID